jgi:hypothetical protein
VLDISSVATGRVLVAWPLPSEGFILQGATSLLSVAVWTNVPDLVQTDGVRKAVLRVGPLRSEFYRLKNNVP